MTPGYISGLLSLRDRVESGQASEKERQQYEQQDVCSACYPYAGPVQSPVWVEH